MQNISMFGFIANVSSSTAHQKNLHFSRITNAEYFDVLGSLQLFLVLLHEICYNTIFAAKSPQYIMQLNDHQ